MKIALGILIGFLLLFALLLGFRLIINPHYKLSVPQFVTDTSKKRATQEEIASLTTQNLNLEEKIASLNKRIDDLLIFGGIIITLLLAINVGVYVNAEKEVNKHFKEHFEEHKSKVLKYVADAEETAGKIKAELEIMQNIRKQAQSIQIPPQ